MKSALIIFARNLQWGRVKTRLAATLGNQKAYEIYEQLLNYTYNAAKKVTADTHVFYSDFIESTYDRSFSAQLQIGQDLGERMSNATQTMFDLGYKKVAIIGSDNLQITPQLINRAFNDLEKYDVVIGPATDGGYYLLAMKLFNQELFKAIPWSTSVVFEKTIAAVERTGYTYSLLPELTDIDEEIDWLKFMTKAKL